MTKSINQYIESIACKETCISSFIQEKTAELFPEKAHMICGPQVGSLLKFLSLWIEPSQIVELGTFTGYSIPYLLHGLKSSSGKCITIDNNSEHIDVARGLLQSHEKYNQINFVLQDAEKAIEAIVPPINLSFIDANKKEYKTHYEAIKKKTPPNGIIVIDNALFHGEVVDQKRLQMPQKNIAHAIHKLNQFIANDNEVNATLLPIRDGVWLIRKR